MNNIDLNKLRDRAYKIACDHGFHDTEHSDEHYLMLVITELSEAIEADRKGKIAKPEKVIMIPHSSNRDHNRQNELQMFSLYVKDTLEDELADATIRLLDWAGARDAILENTNGIKIPDLPLPELMFRLCKCITFSAGAGDETISHIIGCVFSLADHLKINLEWHIEHKMKYNESRSKKHGKKY